MEPVRPIRKEKSETEEFESLAAEAYDKPWWRKMVELWRARQEYCVAALVNGGLEKPAEDTLRGQIQELNFNLNLDKKAKSLAEDKEKERRHG